MLFLAISGGVSAVGLGELHGHPRLGERPRLEVEILGADRLPLDAACFRLVQPEGSGDLPWLKKAALAVRGGQPKTLEIRPHLPLNEPIVELAVYLGCGHEISRQYVLLVSPAPESAPPPAESRVSREGAVPRATPLAPPPVRPATALPGSAEVPPRLTSRRPERRTGARMPDRLLLSSGIDVGEPSLRLATELLGPGSGGREAKEAQREILRLEFRMLMALNEQATSQMATAEKLRNMESTLGELQQRASEFAQRVEQGGRPVELPVAKADSATNQAPAAVAEPVPAKPVTAAKPAPRVESPVSEWSLYGVLLGALLGLGGWLGWKNYRERQQRVADERSLLSTPAFAGEPAWEDEVNAAIELDLPVEPAAMAVPMRLDLELDGGDHGLATGRESAQVPPTLAQESVMPAASAAVDEHFEANPVMELADIMLSFGRVKGAAQALQEYIDNNPQEALQPWIRLMDVYRMADMRAEFESVAHNLNQNFNVEIQQWDSPLPSAGQHDREAAGELRPESIEDMPRIANMICELWATGDVVGYLYQLLRDNRGGKRQGFALPVVDEILFLIELKETSNRIQ